MFSVNTNLGALAALASLSTTQSEMTATQNRVATGKKVSSASDNPAVYAIAQTMNGTIAGLAAVSDNLNFAQSVIGTASSAASQISSQLATLKNTVLQGQQTGIDPTTITNQITSILSNIDSIAQSATFNGVNIAGGTATNNSLSTTKDVAGNAITLMAQDMTASGLNLTGLNTNSGGLALHVTSTTAYAQNDYVKLGDGTNSTYFVLSDGSAAPTAPSKSDANNKVVFVNFATTDSGATVLSKLAAAMQKEGFGASIATGAVGTGAGSIAAGDLVITGQGITSGGSGVTLATGGGAALNTVTSANTAVATVDSAISNLNGKIAILGQNSQMVTGLQNFTNSLSSSLTTGLGALTDADMAAESAKLQSLQTKQQLGIQALSIANQQPQALLSLFRG